MELAAQQDMAVVLVDLLQQVLTAVMQLQQLVAVVGETETIIVAIITAVGVEAGLSLFFMPYFQ